MRGSLQGRFHVSLPPVRCPYPTVTVDPHMFDGSPIVRDSRVPVRRLWAWHRKGVSVETLVKRYASLGWERVLGGLAFAYANEDLVEADLDRERALLDKAPSRSAPEKTEAPT
jgi:uncharacterized protein (DUF433 family)